MTEHWTSSNRDARRRPPRRGDAQGLLELPDLLELRQEVRDLRRGDAREPRRSRRSAGHAPPRPTSRRRNSRRRPAPAYRARRRRRLLIPAAAALIVLVLIVNQASGPSGSFPLPTRSSLAGLGVGQRIVAFANSQLGYSADPSDSYCNKFSAYWGAGAQSCPGSESSEEWCADFAAWAWRKSGVPFSYGFGPGEINAGAATFYSWGVAHGTWHSAYAGYRPRPGDVAVYGISLSPALSAAHVAIVTGDPSGQRGPNVINGDGDRTGYSVVEAGSNQLRADTGHGTGAPLAGYVSPN
jgi:hypothetical protein